MGAYDLDFHAWAMAQADAIRRRSVNEIDWENLAEEVESVGRSQRRELRSYLTLLCAHLLKWLHQPERRSRSWVKTIQISRSMIPAILDDSPSLRPELDVTFIRAYHLARADAADDMHMNERDLPSEPPFTLDEAFSPTWPEVLNDWEPEWRD